MQDKQYMGFWARCLATGIDLALFFMLFFPVLYFFYQDNFNLLIDPSWRIDYLSLNYFLPFVLVIVFWKLKNATPGKLLYKAEIVDATTLQPPTTKQYIIRNLSYFISFIPLGLGYFWIAWDKKKQGFHDKLSNTLVLIPEQEPKKGVVLVWLGYIFGSVIALIFMGLFLIGIMLDAGYLSDSKVYKEKDLSVSIKQKLYDKHYLNSDQTIIYLHPDSMLSYTQSGTLITNDEIIYFDEDDIEYPVFPVSFNYIKEFKFSNELIIFDITMIEVAAFNTDDELLLQVYLSVNTDELLEFKQRLQTLLKNAHKEN